MKELNKLERKVVGLVDRNQTPPIDPQVLKMVEKLKGGNDQEGVLDIQKSREDFGVSMKAIRHSLEKANTEELDALAQEITHEALKIGACRVLEVAFELQSAARRRDLEFAPQVVDHLEMEIYFACEYLASRHG